MSERTSMTEMLGLDESVIDEPGMRIASIMHAAKCDKEGIDKVIRMNTINSSKKHAFLAGFMLGRFIMLHETEKLCALADEANEEGENDG